MPPDPEPVPLFQSPRLSAFGNADGTVDLMVHLDGEAEPRVVELPVVVVQSIGEFAGTVEPPGPDDDAWYCSTADIAAFVAEGYQRGLRDRGAVRA